MSFVRHVVVFDAADVAGSSAFWASMFDGQVVDDDPDFHCVIDANDDWVVGVQRAPDHVPPDWPDGAPQQVHLDLHADDAVDICERAVRLGARLLDDPHPLDAPHGHRVFADPAGHPFCIGWGHPSQQQLHTFLADRHAGGGTDAPPDEPGAPT